MVSFYFDYNSEKIQIAPGKVSIRSSKLIAYGRVIRYNRADQLIVFNSTSNTAYFTFDLAKMPETNWLCYGLVFFFNTKHSQDN